MSYRVEECNIELWDSIVEKSPNGTVFATNAFTNSLNRKFGKYFIYNNNELRGAILVAESDNGNAACSDDFVIYDGVMFLNPTNKQNRSQIISEQYKISEFVAQWLMDRYDEVSIQLHTSITDIRPFLWINYGNDLPKFCADIRYTSYLDISDFDEKSNLEQIDTYTNASIARRQEIRYARKKNVTVVESSDVMRFCDFYTKTMQRQSKDVENLTINKMSSLINSLLSNGNGVLFEARTASGEIGSMAFFAFDTKRAYYVFGANDPEFRNEHTGTAVLWESFYVLANKHNIKEIDLEGINSPQRGWFKLSFGGNVKPYYQINKYRNN